MLINISDIYKRRKNKDQERDTSASPTANTSTISNEAVSPNDCNYLTMIITTSTTSNC